MKGHFLRHFWDQGLCSNLMWVLFIIFRGCWFSMMLFLVKACRNETGKLLDGGAAFSSQPSTNCSRLVELQDQAEQHFQVLAASCLCDSTILSGKQGRLFVGGFTWHFTWQCRVVQDTSGCNAAQEAHWLHQETCVTQGLHITWSQGVGTKGEYRRSRVRMKQPLFPARHPSEQERKAVGLGWNPKRGFRIVWCHVPKLDFVQVQ